MIFVQHAFKILLIKIQLFLVFLYLIFANTQTQLDTFNDNELSIRILSVILYSMALHLFQLKLVMGRLYYFSFGFLFPFGFFIVYFQLAALNAFGFRILDNFELFIWGGSSNISRTISVAGLGIVAYFLGETGKKTARDKPSYQLQNDRSIVRLITYLSYFFYILFLMNSGSYISGAYTSYGASDGTALATYARKLFNISIFSALSIELYRILNSTIRYHTIWSYIRSFYPPLVLLTFISVLISIYVGDRGPVITLLILSFSIFFIKYYKLSFLKTFFIIFILSTIFSLLGEVRTRVVGDSFLDRVSEASLTPGGSEWFGEAENIPGANLIELALSVRTLSVCVRDVPNEFDYHYGMFQFQHLASVFPGAQGLINKLVYGGDQIYNGSASYITYLIHRRPSDYGDGSSIIADLYLDFGIIGVVIIMFLFGRFISRIELDVFQEKIKFDLRFIIFLTFLSNSIYLSRSALMLEFSNIILSYFLIKLVSLFLDQRANKLDLRTNYN